MGKANKAGASANQKYRDLRREWLRRNRTLFWVAGLIIIAVAALWNVLYLVAFPHPWLAGFMTGALVSAWIGMREFTPDWIDNWMLGAEGEKKTKKRLDRLPRETWTVEHDIETQHGNIDHLVIGPGGVFVLDTKRWQGTLTAEGDSLHVERWGDRNDWTWNGAKAVTRLALETRDRIRAHTRIAQYVQPVVVIWGDFPAGIAEGKVTFVHGDRLVEWLESRPASLHESVLPRVSDAATSAWVGAAGDELTS